VPCRLVDTVDRPPSDCCRCRTGCDDHVTMACTSDRHQLTGELLITPPPIAQRSIVMSVSVCLSVCLCVGLCVFVCPRSYLRTYTSDLHQFVSCMLPMAAARSSSGGVVICYVLPVLWMTSYLLISQGCSTSPQCSRSLGLGYKLCAVIPVVGQRTHGTTFRALKVTFHVATPGRNLHFMAALLSVG